MRILNLHPGNCVDGSYKYRNFTPFKQLKKRGHDVQMGDRPASDVNVDIIVLNRAAFPRLAHHLRSLKKVLPVKVVYDADDLLWGISRTNICSSYLSNRRFLAFMRDLKPLIDAVTTTTPELAAEVRSYIPGKPVYILPNCIFPGEWELRKGGNLNEGRFKIGFAGSASHLEDLLMIAPALLELQKKYPFELELFGLSKVELLEEIRGLRAEWKARLFKPEWVKVALKLERYLEELKFSHVRSVPVKDYPDELSRRNWDLGLCPLVDNRFNRCKSSIKFYEYSMVGTAVLASNVLPYSAEMSPDLLVENTYKAWYEAIERMILDEDLREQSAAENKAWVLAHRNIEKNIAGWELVYEDLMQGRESCLSAKS